MARTGKQRGGRNSVGQVIGRCWRQLLATDLLFKLLAFVVLTPLVGLLFRVLLAFSGRSSLVGLEFLYFFLGPVGWGTALALGAFWLAIVALEQVTLFGILVAATFKLHPRILPALRLAARSAPAILGATARMVGWTLLCSAPFLAAGGLVYLGLLSRFDINFYLQRRPPEFWLAVLLAGLIGSGLAWVWIWLASGWFLVLPLVVFEGLGPRRALRESARRARGQRRRIALAVVLWFVVSSLATAVLLGGITWLARQIIPWSAGTTWTLLATSGLMLTLWVAGNWLTEMFSSISFAVVLAHVYRRYGQAQNVNLDRIRAMQGDGENALRITTRRLAWAVGIGVLVSAAVGFLTVQSVRLEDRTEIVAHRGAAGSAPENTLAAVGAAIDQAADWVEIDVQQTRDGEIVVLHDCDLKKVGGDPRTIWSIAAAELPQIDVGSHFHPDYRDERVPTLREVLALCRARSANLNIELKYYNKVPALEDQLAGKVAALVREAGMESHVVYMSLERKAVAQMKALEPTARVGWLTAVAAGNVFDTPADFLAIHADLAERKLLRAAHRRGKQVLVWTVNDPVSMSLLIGRGVDGLITDHPGRAREVLAARAELGLTERLLLELAGIFGVKPQVGEQ